MKNRKRSSRRKFKEAIAEMNADPRIRHLAVYHQHRGNNTLRHVQSVTDTAIRIAGRLHLRVSERELVRGAMLHDFYQYNIDEEGLTPYRHGTRHPGVSLENAMKQYTLTEKEQNIIRSHMWPLTLFHPPKSKEALLVCIADKYCAAKEMLHIGRR